MNLGDLLRQRPGGASMVEIATVNGVQVLERRSAILVNATLQPVGTEVNLRLWMPYVGGGFGLTALPKVGDELLALFPGGDLSGGIALWGHYNGVDTVPEGTEEGTVLLEGRPGDDLRVHIRGNVTVVIDEDLDTTVEGEERRAVTGSRTTEIGGDETKIVAGDETRTVQGNDQVTVLGNRDEVIEGDEDSGVTGKFTKVVIEKATLQSLVKVLLEAPMVEAALVEGLGQQLCNTAFWTAVVNHTHPDVDPSPELQSLSPATSLTQVFRAQ